MDRFKQPDNKNEDIEFNACFLENPNKSFKENGIQFFDGFDLVFSFAKNQSGDTEVVIFHIYNMDKFYSVYIQSMKLDLFQKIYSGILNKMKLLNQN